MSTDKDSPESRFRKWLRIGNDFLLAFREQWLGMIIDPLLNLSKQLRGKEYDALCEQREASRTVFWKWLTQIRDVVKPPKSNKPKSVRPTFEILEVRLNPGGGTTVSFSTSAYSLPENTGSVTITAVLSRSSASTITVDYASSDDTAYASTDYTGVSGTLTFPAGITSETFNVPLLDHVESANVDFLLTLSSPANASLGSPITETVTIIEPPTVEFHTSAQSVNFNPASATVEVDLSASSSLTVTVAYQTFDGTAYSGTDYTGATVSP